MTTISIGAGDNVNNKVNTAFGSATFPIFLKLTKTVIRPLIFSEINGLFLKEGAGIEVTALIKTKDELIRLASSIQQVVDANILTQMLIITDDVVAVPGYELDKSIASLKHRDYLAIGDRPSAASFGPGTANIINSAYKIRSISNGANWVGWGASDLLANMPTAEAFGKGHWLVGDTVYISNGFIWKSLDNGKLRFKKRPGYACIGGSVMAFGNLTYTGIAVSATPGQSTATFVIPGNRLVKGSSFFVAKFDQTEFNGYFEASSISGNNVVATLATVATAANGTGSANALEVESLTDVNFINLGNALAGQPALYFGNFARGGSLSSEHITQLGYALNPANNRFGKIPSFIFCSSGGNDILADASTASIIANWETLITQCEQAGVVLVLTTMPPLGSAHGSYNTARASAGHYLNLWLEDQKAKGRIKLLDVADKWVNKTSTAGDWVAGYTADYLHPLSTAAFKAASTEVKELFDSITYDELGYTETELSSVFAMTGTAGTATGTGASGTVATGFAMTAIGGGAQTAVAAKVPATGISKGEAQKITLTGVVVNDAVAFSYGASQHGSLTTGDLILAGARIRNFDSPIDTDFKGLDAGILITVDGVQKTAVSGILASAASVGFGEGLWDLLFEFPAFKIPAGTTQFNIVIKFTFGANGGVTVDTICDVSIKKIVLD